MKITLVSSCGLVLEQDGQTLLIDALNKQYPLLLRSAARDICENAVRRTAL